MTYISKHYSKHEWEENNSKKAWVNFLIPWDTVSIDNFLECPGEIINFKVGGNWSAFWRFQFNKLRRRDITLLQRHLFESIPNISFERFGSPKKSSEDGIFKKQSIEIMINSFILNHDVLENLQLRTTKILVD